MLAKAAGTRFGLHVSIPAMATLSQHTDEKINKLFHNFTDMVSALSFWLKEAATFEGDLINTMPEIFDNASVLSKQDGVDLPLAGLYQLLEIEYKLN